MTKAELISQLTFNLAGRDRIMDRPALTRVLSSLTFYDAKTCNSAYVFGRRF